MTVEDGGVGDDFGTPSRLCSPSRGSSRRRSSSATARSASPPPPRAASSRASAASRTPFTVPRSRTADSRPASTGSPWSRSTPTSWSPTTRCRRLRTSLTGLPAATVSSSPGPRRRQPRPRIRRPRRRPRLVLARCGRPAVPVGRCRSPVGPRRRPARVRPGRGRVRPGRRRVRPRSGGCGVRVPCLGTADPRSDAPNRSRAAVTRRSRSCRARPTSSSGTAARAAAGFVPPGAARTLMPASTGADMATRAAGRSSPATHAGAGRPGAASSASGSRGARRGSGVMHPVGASHVGVRRIGGPCPSPVEPARMTSRVIASGAPVTGAIGVASAPSR